MHVKPALTLNLDNPRTDYAKTNLYLWLHVCHPFFLTPKTHSTSYAISPQPVLTTQRLETHACIEHLVTSRPLWILRTAVHLRDTEVYPRLPGNLLSSLMDVIPLCDIIKAYTDIYVNTQQLLFNTTLFCAW